MLAEERKLRILEFVDQRRAVRVRELSARLEASEASIRRDLEDLERAGLLRRTHGGAVSNETAAFEPSLTEKEDRHRSAKIAIATAAMQFIDENTTILLDAGSTTLQIARQLKSKRNVGVVTNALNLADELAGGKVEVLLTGGALRPQTMALVGPLAENALADLHVDKLFLGANGIDFDKGVTTPNLVEAETKKVMVRSAKEVVLVADSSKLGRVTFARICALDGVHRLITDDGASPQILEAIAKLGVQVTVAPAEADGRHASRKTVAALSSARVSASGEKS